MSSLTLGERVKAALQGPPKRTQRALAAAAGISPVSVNDWVRDRTKTIEGAHLLKAAKFLCVLPQWLAEGKGPMRPGDGEQAPDAEPEAPLTVAQALPIALEALRKAPPQSCAELAQVLGLLVTTGSALYAQRVVELMEAEPDLPPVRLTPEERERAQRLTDAAHEGAKLDLTKHGRRSPA